MIIIFAAGACPPKGNRDGILGRRRKELKTERPYSKERGCLDGSDKVFKTWAAPELTMCVRIEGWCEKTYRNVKPAPLRGVENQQAPSG